ncbi:hypothetical protein ACVW00_003987 [Marmoricola sp. URHA0025 HA25]
MTTSTPPVTPRMVDELGVRFGLANGALVLVLLLAAALPLDLGETAFIALITAALAAATMRWHLGMVLGLEAWAFFTGFFENRYGVLTLARHDLFSLTGFVLLTVALAHPIRSRLATTVRGHAR